MVLGVPLDAFRTIDFPNGVRRIGCLSDCVGFGFVNLWASCATLTVEANRPIVDKMIVVSVFHIMLKW